MEQGSANFPLIFSLLTVGMLILSGSIVLFVVFYQKKMLQEQFKRKQLELDYQQRMMLASMESEENERRRLAGELHDSIGAMLSTIRVGITTLARQIPDPQSVEQPKQLLDETIQSVRKISRDLMPSTLEKFGFAQAVKELCERFHATSQVPIHYTENGELNSFDKNRELMLFRVVQELLNNALKHSQAKEINVILTSESENVIVAVEDNGVGFDVEAVRNSKDSGRGLGLFNIENRARLLNARIDYDTERTAGSKTTLIVPYEKV